MRNRELKDWMDNFSSVEKIIKHRHGDTIIWKKRVILDQSGNPVSLETYLRMTGERRMVNNTGIEAKTPYEVKVLKACKSDYKKSMKSLFGKDWQKLSRKHRVYNMPSDELLVKQIKESVRN